MIEWLDVWKPGGFTVLEMLAVAVACGCLGYSLVAAWWAMWDAKDEAERERQWRAFLAAETDRYLDRRVDRVARHQSGVPLPGSPQGSGAGARQEATGIRLVRKSDYGQGTTLIH